MTTEKPEAAAAAAPPAAAAAAAAEEEESPSAPPAAQQLPDSFDQLGLDARLLRGLSKMGISKPTAVQVRRERFRFRSFRKRMPRHQVFFLRSSAAASLSLTLNPSSPLFPLDDPTRP